MGIPIDVEALLRGRIVESERLEFKEGWNPEKVMHTICAFANDISDVGGGYILIGIKEIDGSFEVVGMSDSELRYAQNELFGYCNTIEPRYVPAVSVEEIEGKKILAIWAESDLMRPFTCPVSFSSSDRKGGERSVDTTYVGWIIRFVLTNWRNCSSFQCARPLPSTV